MGIKVKFDRSGFDKMAKRTREEFDKIPKQAYDYFVKTTPIATGNARSKTALINRNMIRASYPYAERLDTGYSRQSPDGMVQPTIDHIEKTLVPNALRRINRG